MNQYQCRRKKKIEVNDNRDVVKGVGVLDALKDYALFDECKTCGYGAKADVLKHREAPFEYYPIKSCTLRKV